MQLLELTGLCEMIYASLKSLPHKNPSPLACSGAPSSCSWSPFSGLSVNICFHWVTALHFQGGTSEEAGSIKLNSV